MTVLRARVLTPKNSHEVTWLPDARVAIEDRKIIRVEPWTHGPVDEDVRHGILTPGFVDAHLHFPQTRIVGAATGPLLDWLNESTFPEEARFDDADFAAQVAATFCQRLLHSGTTLAMAYGSPHHDATDALFAAADVAGVRLIAGPVLMDAHCPPALQVQVDPALNALDRLRERWHDRDQRLQVAVIPRFALSCTSKMLQAAGSYAQRHGLWTTTHIAENRDETTEACRRFKTQDYLEIYEQAGLLHSRCVLAHCIHLSESEWDRLSKAGAVVAHCPDSNDFLGSGNMPIDVALRHQVQVAIGSDIAAGRTFRIPRVLSSAFDNGLRVKHRLHPATLFWWGTHGGALALGEPKLGRVEPGFGGDLVLQRVPEWVTDATGALRCLLFDRDAPPPERVWIAGREVHRTSLPKTG